MIFRSIVFSLLISICLVGCSGEQESAATLLKKGQEAFLSGNYAQARESFGKGLVLEPSNHDLIYYMGVSYQKEYVYDSALFYLRKADILFEGNKEINRALFEVAPHVQDWDLAIQAMRKLIELGDSPDRYWPELAEYNSYRNNFVHVLYYCRRLAEQNPEDTSIFLRLIGAAVSANSLSVASAFLDTAIDRFGPRDEFTANRGSIYSFTGQYEKAENIFRSLLAKDSANSYYKLNLASTLASYDRRSKKEEALEILNKLQFELGTGYGIDSLIVRTNRELEAMKK